MLRWRVTVPQVGLLDACDELERSSLPAPFGPTTPSRISGAEKERHVLEESPSGERSRDPVERDHPEGSRGIREITSSAKRAMPSFFSASDPVEPP